MNPSELVNIALEDKIEIEVTGKLPSIPLCEYDLGAFSPNQVREVPVFIALALKNSDICKIRAPFFLKQEYLLKIIEEEKLNEEYSKIYVYFFELSDILINNCYNIEDKKLIRLLVEQIRELRFQKTINGLKGLDSDVLKPQNWTIWEYNEIKPFIVKGMKLINSLKKEE